MYDVKCKEGVRVLMQIVSVAFKGLKAVENYNWLADIAF